MPRKCTLLVLALTSCITAAAFAQSSAEFGRASGGQLDLVVKTPSQFSGSLGLTTALSNGLGRYGATFGGTAVKDRVWFFATADHNEMRFPSTVSANLGDRNSLGTSFRTQKNMMPAAIPSSFLSLRYTGIVSSNMFVTATVSQTSSHAQ